MTISMVKYSVNLRNLVGKKKGNTFFRFCLDRRLVLLNTLAEDPAGSYTCHFDLRSLPKQIDYICSNLPAWARSTCGVFQSAATLSDHRALLTYLVPIELKPVHIAPVSKVRKPIRWTLTDESCNHQIGHVFGMPAVIKEVMPENAYHAYSDGSCIYKRRRPISASWGFAVFPHGCEPTMHDQPIQKAYGPVVDKQHPMFIGSERWTNNTAEMSAAVEFLLWLLSNTESPNPVIVPYTSTSLTATVILHTDSRYVMGIVLGKFRARENIHLATLLRHLWRRASRIFNLHIVWVKGHSGDVGNDLADECARFGGDAGKQAEWWDRPFVLSDWGSDIFNDSLRKQEQVDDDKQTFPETSISKFTETIVEVALRCGSASSNKELKLTSDDPDVQYLDLLTQGRRDEKIPLIRQIISLDICRTRRRIRRRLSALRCIKAVNDFGKGPIRRPKRKESVNYLKKIEADGSSTKVSSIDGMRNLVSSFYRCLFNDENEEAVPTWINKVWGPHLLESLPIIDADLVRCASLKFKKGRTCSSDLLVIEMLLELDDDLLDILAVALRQRLLNTHIGNDDLGWDHHMVSLIKKRSFKNSVGDLRPIAVLPVLYKVYSRVLLMLTEGKLEKLIAPQFAFRPGYQAHEVVFMLRNIIEKSVEWNIPISILDGDLYKAYDTTKHSRIIRALKQKGIPREIIVAWVREFHRTHSTFCIVDHIKSEAITRAQSLLQGDPSAPLIFNATLDVAACEFIKVAEEKQWGLRLEDTSLVSLLLFADNFWLIADSPKQLSEMTEAWLCILQQHGWSVPIGEATWCTTGSDDVTQWVVQLSEGEVRRSARAEGFKALGAWITFDNAFERELQNRFSKAWSAFFVANKEM